MGGTIPWLGSWKLSISMHSLLSVCDDGCDQLLQALLPQLSYYDGRYFELWVRTNIFFPGLLLSEYFVTATRKGGVMGQRRAWFLMSNLTLAMKWPCESFSLYFSPLPHLQKEKLARLGTTLYSTHTTISVTMPVADIISQSFDSFLLKLERTLEFFPRQRSRQIRADTEFELAAIWGPDIPLGLLLLQYTEIFFLLLFS